MQIALTKKLADALKMKPGPANEEENPLFTWTANWSTTWDNRRAEDQLVLVNNANRFTVAVYQVKRKDLKNIEEIIKTAISNTLLTKIGRASCRERVKIAEVAVSEKSKVRKYEKVRSEHSDDGHRN